METYDIVAGVGVAESTGCVSRKLKESGMN
jgi:hypothetical protein